MKRWLAPILLTVGLVAGAGPAVAAPNPNKPSPNPTGTYDLRALLNGIGCPGLDITATLTGKSKTITLADDRFIGISPGATITLTADTGKTVSYVITGQFHIEVLPDGTQEFRATGRNLLGVPARGKETEGVFLTTGNVNFALKGGAELRRFSGPGRVTDVCKALEA
jgi:hypothetical protein